MLQKRITYYNSDTMSYVILFLLFLVGLLVLPLQSFAQGSLTDLDAKNGFRNVKFGVLRSTFKDLVSTDADPNEKSDWKNYERRSDSKTLGDIPLDYISYKFYKNYLIQISLQSKGHFEEIFETITQAYGKHSEIKKFTYNDFEYTEYYWKGAKATIRLLRGPEYMSLEFRTNTDTDYFDRIDNQIKMQKRLKGL